MAIYTLSENLSLKSVFFGISEKNLNRIRHLRLMTLYESVTNGRTNGDKSHTLGKLRRVTESSTNKANMPTMRPQRCALCIL